MIQRRPHARWDETEAFNLGNVIPFVRPRGDDAPPLAEIGPAERPAPDRVAASSRPPWWMAFFAGSILAHAAVAALFLRTPEPVTGIGLEAISVEVVFGGDAPAGVAATPGEQETQPQPEETPEEPVAKQQPEEPEPIAETPPPAPPQEPQQEAMQQEPKKQETKEKETKEKERESKKEEAPPPSHAAGGVGRGQSRSDANYKGLVAAHLARHKRFPQGAQSKRSHGTAVVSFQPGRHADG